jgi:hypothetical protein
MQFQLECILFVANSMRLKLNKKKKKANKSTNRDPRKREKKAEEKTRWSGNDKKTTGERLCL